MSLTYKHLSEHLAVLEKTTSKVEKTQIIISLLKYASEDEIEYVVLFLLGRLYPEHETKELGISQNLVIKAMSKAYGYDSKEIEEMWKNKGDLGKVAEELSTKKRQITLMVSSLELKEIISSLRNAAEVSGEGSLEKKLLILSGLLLKAKGLEARYLVRFVLGDMRIGVAQGIMRDAIIGAYFAQFYWESLFANNQAGMDQELILKYWKGKKILISKEASLSNPAINLVRKIASEVVEKKEEEIRNIESFHFSVLGVDVVICASNELGAYLRDKYVSLVERAYALINDFPAVAKIAYEEGEKGLENVKPYLFRPIRVMLAQKASSILEAFQIVGRPAAFEYKYDGFRCQIHKKGKRVEIFTRRLENVTKQFPDIVEYVNECINADECIIEGEAIGYDVKTKKWLPFQRISRRIRRKYDIEKMAKEIPVMVHMFDVIYLQGEKVIDKPFKERRKLLESIVEEQELKIVLAKQIITSNEEEAQRFYDESLDRGNEGIMAKNLDAPYKPGLRVGNMIKIKPTMETLDLVIVGAEWGEGKRAGYLSSYELACLDEDTGEFLTIGRLGTGIKEKTESGGVSLEELTDMLKPYIIKEDGKKVKIQPKIVVEVAYEEIQKSPTYSSGFALRFPRLVRIRDDKSPEDADTLSRVWMLYQKQRTSSSTKN